MILNVIFFKINDGDKNHFQLNKKILKINFDFNYIYVSCV